ncbi:flagellar basal body P-ring formation chaperone FlgA [Aestuariibacter sp. A3R04]|uniref:flagellar basal body P-ring formation chaperone FlgA n=1 Tax=Aestuariibacter sp. A3R04 TaxID=2841571 RepID=UPI00209035B4|nr:flagellar basal body P-ring formation chaperone FlgA [Aestuariibacter sp. A3R04]
MKKKTSYRVGQFPYVPMATILALLLNIVSFSTFAQPEKQLHSTIQEGAEAYLLAAIGDRYGDENLQVEIVPIDDRIQIPSCPVGFQYHADPSSLSQSYVSVRVSCGNNDWYLFTNARVSRTRTVVVTSGMISPGTVLSAENLSFADVDVNMLRHTSFDDMTQLIGARVKRRIRNGQPIQSNMLCFVCKGDRITILAQAGGMRVKTAGIAKQDGVIGDNIQVVNASSNKTLIAEVANTQTVVVNL